MSDSESSKGADMRRTSTACSPAHVEEIIAVIWTILFVLLWQAKADSLWLWIVGIKAGLDHLCAIKAAVTENLKENDQN